jgi:hypothetical protein
MPDALVDTANVAMIAHPVTEVLENEGMMFCMFFFFGGGQVLFLEMTPAKSGVYLD